MAGFYIYETYDLHITLSEDALADAEQVVVSIVQGKVALHFTGAQVGVDGANALNVRLSQEDTARFTPGMRAKVQVNVRYADSGRDTSAQGELEVYDNLYREVMDGS